MGDAEPLSSIVMKAEPGMDKKIEIGEVAGLESVFFKMGKERGDEMQRNIQRSAKTAWVNLDIVVYGQLWQTGCILDRQKNVNMVTFAVRNI